MAKGGKGRGRSKSSTSKAGRRAARAKGKHQGLTKSQRSHGK